MALAHQNTGPKEAAVWQPLPSLKAVDHKGFVRVQDGHGQTSHFTRLTFKHLDTLPQVPAHGSTAPTSKDKGAAEETPVSPATHSDHDEDLQALQQLAYERGVAEGRQLQLAEQTAAQEAHDVDTQAQETLQTQDLLAHIQASIEGLHEQPALRYEPLKRLALHLAEQLVLTELSVSSAGIQRLIERCLDTLDVPAATQVVVDLNPDDLALLQSRLPNDVATSWRLQASHELAPGSVRVTADDAVVTDLVENRLSALAATLLQEPKRWQAQTGFAPERLQSRHQAVSVQDAMPKAAFASVDTPEARESSQEIAPDLIELPQAPATPMGEDHAD